MSIACTLEQERYKCSKDTHTHTQKPKTQKKKRRCNDNQQTTVTHFGENKRLHFESFKQNYYIFLYEMMMIAFITFKSSLVPLFEGL